MVDHLGGCSVTTYDIRLKRPNREPAIDVAAMHSLEHIIATYLRNGPDWKDEVIYWGPMGCLTSFYLILKCSRASKEIYALVLRNIQSRKRRAGGARHHAPKLRILPYAQPGYGKMVRKRICRLS